MKVDSDFDRVYDAACEDLHDLGPVLENLIRALLRAQPLRVHSVTHRVKTQRSTRRKLTEKGEDPSLDGMHDLLGARVITFFPDEVDEVAKVIEAEFEIDRPNSVDKRSVLDPDRFGYLSLHYVASLDETRSTLTEHQRFVGRKFEIQIRSILQHSWAEIEHNLGYRTRGAIPASVRRRFSRLAGLLEIADDEFEAIREDVLTYQEEVGKDVTLAPSEVTVNRDSIGALIASNNLISELDHDFLRMASSDMQILGGEGEEYVNNARAEEMLLLGLDTVGAVLAALDERKDLIRKFFEIIFAKRRRQVYPGMSLFMLTYVLSAELGSAEAVAEFFTKANIGTEGDKREKLAKRILDVYAQATPAPD